MYATVPIEVPGLVSCAVSTPTVSMELPLRLATFGFATLANPKSRIFTCPRFVTKMFAGLMSRCTMPSLCAASSASAT